MTNGDVVANGPTVKAVAVKKAVPVKARKNSVAQKAMQNGEALPQEVKAITKVRNRGGGRGKVGAPQAKAEAKSGAGGVGKSGAGGVGKSGAGGVTPTAGRGRGGRRPSKAATPGAAQGTPTPRGVGQTGPRPILKIPAMATPPQTSGVVLGSPPTPRNKSPVTSPVVSPTNVPPPWSNPNLVIRTRRAAIHSPVQVSGKQVLQGVAAPAQATGVLQQVQQPIGVVQSGGVVRLVSPGPMVALAASQPLQVVSAARVRPAVAPGLPAGQLSLAGTRVLGAGVNAAGLQGSLVRMPDGSTAVLGQISGANIITAHTAANQTIIVTGAQAAAASPTFIVSGTNQSAMGARAVLATNLAATSRARTPTVPRLAATPQVVSASGLRTVQLGAGGLTAPLTLRGVGVGGMPVGVNLVKAGTSGVQIPIVGTQGLALRGGQIIQTNLAQSAAPQSYVLITPRVRAPTPVTATTPSDLSGSAEKKGAG